MKTDLISHQQTCTGSFRIADVYVQKDDGTVERKAAIVFDPDDNILPELINIKFKAVFTYDKESCKKGISTKHS